MNDDIRYSRQITLPAIGTQGQTQLGDASVLIVGMGGLGTPASMYLANSGVGQLLINDFDTVDTSNLPRQILYRDTDTGKAKATAAAECLKLINPNVTTIAMGSRLARDGLTELTAAVDVVLDCTDNFTSRWLINEVCADMKTPLITGAAIRWEGQLSVFRHDQAGGPCYRCLYSEADENLNDCAGQGIIAPVAGTVGTMMATETIKLLLAIESVLAGNLWVYDGLAGTSKTIAIPAQPDCPVCSIQAATSL
ncbi:MAG: HesA/MoeB/ThiF family protein [Gammaproteobacteria bacterium]|nr:HesA/MoeB/ThiF family protein [Gammaproteobacteria bacterium]MCP4089549.1 HesA/MoeB/ThiF family protein [Gammaproteobacteria bacterium]MCP4276255.1 HesA/MoeB/ThiF family protein [Gammaproteobacteria bacterium]MCP4832952.1 HesA/MoeB/ThiF family protein [Gammaproteobacteria bacterium]MCP4930077.1 HesA/MoeB/ThiF family protein [Gammaproteobacteria bacterium]